MIKINSAVEKKQRNFWNKCVFHPTDAVEDPWGRRILDRMARDGAIKTVRVYAMLEDIVYLGEGGELLYDFRISDLRLDYLVDAGYDLVIAYAGMPDCIAASEAGKSTAAKNKTRYKGKMWNTNPPRDYALWEEICYEYTKHIIERYGERAVKDWRIHCFNEPDVTTFFCSNITDFEDESRCEEYLRMYEGFVKGVRRANDKIRVGGPALAVVSSFLERFLLGVKERGLDLDYISVHFYGTDPELLNSGEECISVDYMMRRMQKKLDIVKKCGFENTPIVIDEWGACSHGFFNIEECKALIFRETEVFSAYFIKFIHTLIHFEYSMDSLMICLSGQHEMTEDFSGFRNFFTMNFIAKPIYNAYLLSSKLGDRLLDYSTESRSVTVIPTKNERDGYAVALSYSAWDFDESIPTLSERVVLDESIVGRLVTVWCIDREHTNPYRVYERMGITEPTAEEISLLREEGRLKPIAEYVAENNFVDLTMTANSVFLITVD